MKIDTTKNTVIVRGELRETLTQQDARFNELHEAWSRGDITSEQFAKANKYKFSLNQLLFYENCSFWDKLKITFGKKELPKQEIKYCESMDILYTDRFLEKIMKYGYDNDIIFSFKQLQSFDPRYDKNYAQNFEDFVRESNTK